MIKGPSILITGGSGSFGNVFVRHILTQDPSRVVIYSRGEHRQELMERAIGPHEALRYYIGDVRDYGRLEMAMQGIDIVIHAAAMKVVPKCEMDPIEAVHTNILGAENVIRAALKCGVQKVLALSTDKACAPVNLYGATKLAAEKLFVAARNIRGGHHIRFSVARYGNVHGSQGSVAPLFQKIAAQGQPLPITDINMTRFVITLDRAVAFVVACLDQMQGGEIFVPRIPSMRVVDLAEAIAPGRETVVVGVRPGEKIHETLITEDEACHVRPMSSNYGWILDEHGTDQHTKRYTSDTNDQWLSVEQLRQLVS